NGGVDYSIDPQRVSFSNVFFSVLGGTVTGSVEVQDWRSSQSSPGRQRGSANLRVANIGLHNAATAAASRQFPVDRLSLSGVTSGAVEVRWTGAPNSAVAKFDLGVKPLPARGARPEFDGQSRDFVLGGSATGSYFFASDRLHFESLDLSGPSLQLNLTGVLGTREADARLTVRTSDAGELVRMASVISSRFRQFEGVTGEGSFSGTLGGTLQSPRVEGQVMASNLVAPVRLASGEAPGQPATAERTMRLDSFSGALRFMPNELLFSDTVLRSGNSSVTGLLRASLVDGELVDTSDIYGRITLRDTELAELGKVAGIESPITGATSGSLQIGGSWGEPRAAGQVRLHNATLYGETVESAEAVVLLAGGELVVERFSLSFHGAQATGRGAYNWTTDAFQLDFRGSGVELARLAGLQNARFLLSGQMTFDVRGSGTLREPSLGGKMSFDSVALNGERLGAITLQGVTRDRALHIEAASQFTTGEFALQGAIGLHDNLPTQMELRIARMDVDAFLSQILRESLTGHSSAAGVIRLQGPLRNPDQLAVRGNLDQISAGVQGIELTNQGPVQFRVERKVLLLERLRLTGQGTEMTAAGSVELAGRRSLGIEASGTADMKLLSVFSRRLESSGKATFRVEVGGTAARPDMRGTAQLENGSVTHRDLPNGLSELNGTFVFNQDRLEVQKLTGRSGGGVVVVGGFLNLGSQPGLNLSMRGQGVRLRHPPGISSLLNLDLQLTGGRDRYTLSGNVVMTRFGITPQFDLGYYMAGLRQASQPDPLSPLSRLQLNLHVVSAAELQVETSAAKLTGDVELNVRGTAASPVLLGTVNATEGEMIFRGARYQVNHAEITFSNPVRVEPVFDAELVTRVREYEITQNFYGPLDRLSTTYRSDPPLPTADIVGLLAFGNTRPESVQVSRPSASLTQSESQAILQGALDSSLDDRVQRLFGVSRLRISPPEAVGTQVNPSARVTVEQQVSRNMTVIYVTNVSQSSQQVIQMEYNVSPSVSVVATRDQNGIVSFDVRIRQRRR
ncbi:MAG: translocation/assembly module TamB domain-containing protein, partial [Candidatus Korobacteraceae bacterium]